MAHEIVHRREAEAAPGRDPLRPVLAKAVDLAEAEPERQPLLRRLQNVVPLARIDVDGADRHAVIGGVTHDLRRRVKTHRLRVQKRGGEGGRVVALDPGRDIDEAGEARGMALGKTVFAEPLDLVEAALGEIALIAAPDHALDHHALIFVHGAEMAERRHGAAQPVGVGGRKARRHHGEAHRLLLEQRHAERPPQHLLQFVGRAVLRRGRGKGDVFDPLPAAQIGMHHVALDRPGPDDRHLDDEVIELARPQTRQHVHLRPALDLEHADRVARAEHVVDGRILPGDRVQRVALAARRRDQVERLADAGQHAERQDIDLHHPDRVDVVLVPFDEAPVLHHRRAARHQVVQELFRQHEAADMLREMARETA